MDVESKKNKRNSKRSVVNDGVLESPPAYEQIERPLPPVPELPTLSLDSNAGPSKSTSVTPDECVAHLKFLAALADLRDTVSTDDGLFGIYDSEADKFISDVGQARARIREKRWAVYTARAVKRFSIWWDKCIPTSGFRPRHTDLKTSTYPMVINCNTQLSWPRDALPPLDVMMVLHSYMLNPRAFLEDCIRYGQMSLWKSGFPWQVVNDCIDNRSLDYVPGKAAERNFEEKTGHFWDNLGDPPDTFVNCPKCRDPVCVPWTAGEVNGSLDKPFEDFYGFADKSFRATCPKCQFMIDHERLKVAKFASDVEAFVTLDYPMPGTFYNLNGIPEWVSNSLNGGTACFPNNLVNVLCNELRLFTDARLGRCRHIHDLRKEFQGKIRDKRIVQQARGTIVGGDRLFPREQVAIRRMMSRYWDNHSPFALDLVGAVIRQGTFVQKMDNIDWLHSPALMKTMQRLIDKYHVFFLIMAKHPKRMAVPTLDVDLAWHTHQLSPSRYFSYSTEVTRRHSRREIFVNHDDKVEEVKLADGFEWTSIQYTRETNGGIYSECTCWYCEAVRAADLYGGVSVLRSSAVKTARNVAANLHDQPGIFSDPNKNPHISAHNAVRDKSPFAPYVTLREMKAAHLLQNLEKSRRRAEKWKSKNGEATSSQKERSNTATADIYAVPMVWGYPMYMPYYAPYMCDPGVNYDAYAADPVCMNSGTGAIGNCIAGACSGTVGAGACASMGAAACRSVAAGGCGNASGCGGGGCGGGGCGGGGGGCGGGG